MIDIKQGDCLELMKEIPDKSIDMVLCDLPYGTTDCKWDRQLPLDTLWEGYLRVIKDNGVIALFGSEPFSTKLRMSNFELYRYDWYWLKSKPSLYQHAKNRPMKKVETISIFSKAKWGHKSQLKNNRMVYYPQGVIENGIKTVTKNYHAGGIIGERPNQIGKQYMSYTNFPHDVLIYDSLVGKKSIHPTQKPVALLEYLIKTYTNEGETVLDNCMGSGSTGVACINTNRNFIGYELDDFLNEIYRLTKGTIIIFCGVNQVSNIYKFFEPKAKSKEGTIREIIWHKTNPSPMNGQYVYLNSIEYAVWFRKRGATFNAHCKHNVFDYPTGRSKIHPTEKNHELIKDLILDNSNEGDIIFDPCAGSLAHCLVAKENGRRYVGCELNKEYFDSGVERLNK